LLDAVLGLINLEQKQHHQDLLGVAVMFLPRR